MTRSSSKYPPHIDPSRLPPNVRYDPRGRGRWTYRKSKSRGDRGKETRIGDATTTMAEIWRTIEQIATVSSNSFRGISVEFRNSPDYKRLHHKTQLDYDNCHKAISERITRSGAILGDIPLEAWTPGAVRRYRDERARTSKSRAAHEIRYMKRVFKWAIQYDLTNTNPAKEIDLKGLTAAREHYVLDADYYAGLNIQRNWKVACAAHIAYLTGRRKTDVLALNLSNVQPEGLLIKEGKTGKPSIILWTDELQATVDMLTEDGEFQLFDLSESGFDSAWQRMRQEMKRQGLTPFQFKDLRAKHGSDLDEVGGDATGNLMHSSAAVTRRHYLRKAKKVVSLR